MLSTCLYVPTREAGRQRPVLLACMVELWGRRACREVVVDGFAGPSVSSWDQEFHGYQGALLDPRLSIVRDTAFLMNGCDERASLGLIQNGCRPGGQVRVYALFEVEGELRVRQQVGIPGTASWRSPCDVHLPLNMVEPYLNAAWLPGVPAPGGDVNHAALFQCVVYLLIHTSSPVELLFVRFVRDSIVQLSLSRLNHWLPGCEAHPEVMQGTAAFHHQITNALLPQADPVFHQTTALDTAIDMLDPEPTLVQGLVRQLLLPRQLRAPRFLRRHEDLDLREREREEAQILQ